MLFAPNVRLLFLLLSPFSLFPPPPSLLFPQYVFLLFSFLSLSRPPEIEDLAGLFYHRQTVLDINPYSLYRLLVTDYISLNREILVLWDGKAYLSSSLHIVL